jgi:hypothetical protein
MQMVDRLPSVPAAVYHHPIAIAQIQLSRQVANHQQQVPQQGPVVLSGLPVGSRVVRLEADGYQTWSAAIRVIANQQTRVTATLYREPDSAASQ